MAASSLPQALHRFALMLVLDCRPCCFRSNDFVNLNGLYHTDSVLDAICLQRNAVRQVSHFMSALARARAAGGNEEGRKEAQCDSLSGHPALTAV
jgi:hypothetical protein